MSTSAGIVIDVARNGDWLPLEELCTLALAAAGAAGSVTLNLTGLDHLDGGALQIVLALAGERKRQGHALHLANASPSLTRWFEFAGAGKADGLIWSQIACNEAGALKGVYPCRTHLMKIDPNQFRQTHLQESAEHLESMEADLLALRSAPGDVAILNSIFRAAHSMKGGAGS